MTKIIETLPPSDTCPEQRMEWEPTGIPGRGVLTLHQWRGRKHFEFRYFVAEFAADEMPGRAVRMFKPEGEATADEPATYDVTCTADGRVHSCECRGYLRWNKPCKHVLALHALLQNGGLDMADGPTVEVVEQSEPVFSFDQLFVPSVNTVTPSIPWEMADSNGY